MIFFFFFSVFGISVVMWYSFILISFEGRLYLALFITISLSLSLSLSLSHLLISFPPLSRLTFDSEFSLLGFLGVILFPLVLTAPIWITFQVAIKLRYLARLQAGRLRISGLEPSTFQPQESNTLRATAVSCECGPVNCLCFVAVVI